MVLRNRHTQSLDNNSKFKAMGGCRNGVSYGLLVIEDLVRNLIRDPEMSRFLTEVVFC